jgi:uncharacterized protein (DUF58 family)
VHWRSSARRGELMVRREDQPWQSRATLFLDTRRIGHRGSGPGSSFEWSVSATASVGAHLLRRGYSVRLATDAGAAVTTTARESGPSAEAEGLLLDALAVVGPSSVGQLSHAAMGVPLDGSYGLLVAVLGVITPVEAEAMVRIRHRAATGLAIVVDSPTWAPAKERSPQQIAEQLAESIRMLRQGGWRVVVARAGDTVPDTWTHLVLGSAGTGASAGARSGSVARDSSTDDPASGSQLDLVGPTS